MVSTAEIREKFLSYFAERDHQVVASSPLVPGNDKTLLFTNAGMVQFKDVFTGADVRDYKRAATAQRCVRAGGKHNDLDNVGYTARHHTFFEMLGNFSFGDYFKEDAIGFAWEFLTGVLGLPKDKLWVTVFEEDDEAEAIWVETIGVPKERVVRIGAKDNFWAMGDTGPCGPCSEIFYDHGPEVAGGPPGSPDEDGDRYIEIWNLVFMQFDKSADGTMTPLPKPCVDTGMGLERIAAVLQHVHSNYQIDLFHRLIGAIASLANTTDLDNPSLNVIADHIRSCAFLITDGVVPSNEGRGYVLRRIIRRAARHGHKLGLNEPFFYKLVDVLAGEMGEAYPELVAARERVVEQLLLEEQRFAATLSSGMKILEDEIAKLDSQVIPGDVVFKLYDTYGFPVDLTGDIARERNLSIDEAGFEENMEAQRERARAASTFAASAANTLQTTTKTDFLGYSDIESGASVAEIFVDGRAVDSVSGSVAAWVVLDRTPFYGESGGQVGDTGVIEGPDGEFVVTDTQKNRGAFLHAGALSRGSLSVGDRVTARIDVSRRNAIRRHHSATHLLHGALRDVLGTHVQQKGSLVNDQYLRFDFSHNGPISRDDLRAVERWIDEEVRVNSPCEIEEMSMDEALAAGAMALFGEKYGDRVRVVRLGDRSVELCGGTHVGATGELGSVRVVGETGIAAGVRRIEAVSGNAALAYNQQMAGWMETLAESFKTSPDGVVEKVEQLRGRQRELTREIEQLQAKLASYAGNDLASQAEAIGRGRVVMARVDGADGKTLKPLVESLMQSLEDAVVVLAGERDGKAAVVAAVSKSLQGTVGAGDMIRLITGELGGRGGGKPDFAQGGAASLEQLDAAFDKARATLQQSLGA